MAAIAAPIVIALRTGPTVRPTHHNEGSRVAAQRQIGIFVSADQKCYRKVWSDASLRSGDRSSGRAGSDADVDGPRGTRLISGGRCFPVVHVLFTEP